jgi:hypothetical protein
MTNDDDHDNLHTCSVLSREDKKVRDLPKLGISIQSKKIFKKRFKQETFFLSRRIVIAAYLNQSTIANPHPASWCTQTTYLVPRLRCRAQLPSNVFSIRGVDKNNAVQGASMHNCISGGRRLSDKGTGSPSCVRGV